MEYFRFNFVWHIITFQVTLQSARYFNEIKEKVSVKSKSENIISTGSVAITSMSPTDVVFLNAF